MSLRTSRGGLAGLAAFALVALPAALGPGCAGAPAREGRLSIREKLSRVGLELVDERDAPIPPSERGRAVPVRVIPGFPEPALPEDLAGYLIVGVGGRRVSDAAEILRALEAWEPGEILAVRVLRNPRAGDAGWWEAEVGLALPAAGRTEGVGARRRG